MQAGANPLHISPEEAAVEGEESTEPLDLQQPLEILRSTARRLMDRQIPASSNRLEEMYSHLRGAVGDVIDLVSQRVSQSLQLARENQPEVPDDSEAAETVEMAQEILNEVQEEMQSALDEIKASFFSASNFQECEARLPDLALFEARLEGSLLRLEEALQMTDDPELFGGASGFVPAPSLPEALQHIAEALEHVEQHLRDGDKTLIEHALTALGRAQNGLQAALVDEP